MNKVITLPTWVFMLSAVFLYNSQYSFSAPPGGAPDVQSTSVQNLTSRDYTFGFWQNGMRKHKEDASPDILCLESGYYALALDMAQLDKPRFGLIDSASGYESALKAKDRKTSQLAEASLRMELELNGKIYRAKRCRAAAERKAEGRMQNARLWESARLAQHYDFNGLEFVDDAGQMLVTNARLDLVAWPDSMAFNVEMEPVIQLGDNTQQGVIGKGQGVYNASRLIAHQPEHEHEQFTVEAWVKIPEAYIHKNRSWIVSKNGHEGTEGYFGIGIKGDTVSAGMNIGGVDRRNYYEIRSVRHSLVPDKWHHVAMIYDGKKLSLYLDGSRRDSVEINKKRIPGNGEMRIGKKADNRGPSARVVVDQVRIWNKPLDRHAIIRNTRNPGKIEQQQHLTYVNDFEDGPELQLPVWNNAKVRIMLAGAGKNWGFERVVAEPWGVGQRRQFTLNCRLNPRDRSKEKIQAQMKHNGQLGVAFRDDYDCYVASIKWPKRQGKRGYNDIRDYDEIDITIDSEAGRAMPFLMEIIEPANITGVCPVLCDEQGRPTGIPVQLSKNWHYSKMGAYVRAYALLPAAIGQKKYKLRLAYGFYGSLPSASHAQLSLVGYNGNGRWDQLAIGCWGETYCMDVDMSCTDVAVTDVRCLMLRRGAKGAKWAWTDGGWGGDWLGLNDEKNKKRLFNGVKTAYLAHGPCLSEVKYNGFYGSSREVAFDSTVRTLRTDDFARTFTSLNYTFDKKVSAEGWLFKMGRTGGYLTPRIAYGNVDGLIKEQVVPQGLQRDQVFVDRTTLQGRGPWWVSFPGAHHENLGSHISGSGYRAMVIRSYKAVIGGREYHNPTVKFPVYHVSADGKSGLDFLLTAPEGVAEFNPGDRVELDVEWITLPRQEVDYYGPNQAFRDHLKASPSSWKTTHREAAGNDLKVAVQGGKLLKNYPVIVHAEAKRMEVSIKGGVGYVPLRFEGLDSATGYSLFQMKDGKENKLDQSVHGNDFWQSDYDASSQSYKLTYNLPLDGLAESRWVLRPVSLAEDKAPKPEKAQVGANEAQAHQPN